MAEAAILKKTVKSPYLHYRFDRFMKFGTLTQIGPLQGTDRENFQFFKNQDGGGSHLEKSQKSRYHSSGLTDLREIWYDYAQ